MARLIGMDEAGLGPNLGPFVVAVTVWDVPGPPATFDFWGTFDQVLTNAPGPQEKRLHVADSKQVFQPKRGFAALERGVLSALKMLGHAPRSLEELSQLLTAGESPIPAAEATPPGLSGYRSICRPNRWIWQSARLGRGNANGRTFA